jgi:hypothetical protein
MIAAPVVTKTVATNIASIGIVVGAFAVATPIAEELLKAYMPKTAFVLHALEVAHQCYKLPQCTWWLTGIFHASSWLEYKYGTDRYGALRRNMIVHGIWNSFVIFRNLRAYGYDVTVPIADQVAAHAHPMSLISTMRQTGMNVLDVFSQINPMSLLDTFFLSPPKVFTKSKVYPVPEPIKKCCFRLDNLPVMHSTAITDVPIYPSCTPSLGLWPLAITIHGVAPVIASGCYCNEVRAVVTRQLLNRPDQDPVIIRILTQFTRDMLTTYFGPPPIIYALEFDEWNSRFPLEVQKINQIAHDSLIHYPLNPRDFTYDGFVKQEKQLDPIYVSGTMSNVYTKFAYKPNLPIDNDCIVDLDPRLISSASKRYKVSVAPSIAAAEKYLSTITKISPDHDSRPFTLTKGWNPEQLGTWYGTVLKKYDNPMAICDDGSRWDATMNEDLLYLELLTYEWMSLEHVDRIRQALFTCKGVTKNGFRYSVRGTRKSGDPNTSCGNCLINGEVHTFVFTLILCLGGVTPDNIRYSNNHFRMFGTDLVLPSCKHKMDMGVDGDDNITICEQADYHKADSWLLDRGESFVSLSETLLSKCGIIPKLSIYKDPRYADYLSGYFYPVGKQLIHGPKIYRPLCKSGWSTKNFTRQKREQWIYSNAVASQLDWSHIPILNKWTKAQRRLLDTNPQYNHSLVDGHTAYRQHVSKWTDPDMSTYLFVQEVTGLTLSMIRVIEAEIDEIYVHCAYYNPDLDTYIKSQMTKRYR